MAEPATDATPVTEVEAEAAEPVAELPTRRPSLQPSADPVTEVEAEAAEPVAEPVTEAKSEPVTEVEAEAETEAEAEAAPSRCRRPRRRPRP